MRYILYCGIFTLLFTNSFIAKAQDKTYKIQCTYELNYQPDSTNTGSKKSEEMLLLLNDHYSIFTSKNNYLRDSVDRVVAFNSANMNSTLQYFQSVPTNFRFTIIKGSTDELLYIDFVYHDRLSYTEPKNNFNWTILHDTATINGFNCQKATASYGGRKWIAWFAPGISISDGPYKFNGLPGLIIKINDSQNHYSFMLTDFVNREGIVLTSQKEIMLVTKSKFYALQDYYNSNPLEVAKMNGTRFISGEENIRKRLEERLRTNNNPLELTTLTKARK